MNETYRNQADTRITIVGESGAYLWLETELPNGETDRGRIKKTDKFRLVRDGTWRDV